MKFEKILEWYTGKASDVIRSFVIPALVECEELGAWKKGVSRSVKAALNKQAPARRFVDAKPMKGSLLTNGDLLKHLKAQDGKKEPPLDGWGVQHAMMYGRWDNAKRCLDLVNKLQLAAERAPRETFEAWGTAWRWCRAFAPIAELCETLDSRRPKPTIVPETQLSPTVTENVYKAMGLHLATIQSPPWVEVWEEETLRDGRKIQVVRRRMQWPDGTQHNKSKFYATNDNMQCQACGHAIRNPFNWVPLLAYGRAEYSHIKKGTPYSLWVGRDCAKRLFDCKVDGDAKYDR